MAHLWRNGEAKLVIRAPTSALALPPDREAVQARRGMSKSIPPCPCMRTRCEPGRPRGPALSRDAPRLWWYQDAPSSNSLSVTAPSDADVTALAYLASTPRL